MKNTKKIIFISILILVAMLAMTACDLTGLSESLKTDVAKSNITLESPIGESEGLPYYLHTGQEICPSIVVEYGGRVLQKDQDYAVEYFDNVNLGTAKIKVAGSGNFKGEVVKQFLIVDPLNPPRDDSPTDGELTYIFSADGADLVKGDLTQYVKSVDEIIVPTVEKRGYEFLYWTYDSRAVNFTDKPSLPKEGATFVAQFSVVTYSVVYHLDGGQNSSVNKEQYTVEDYFELQDAEKNGMQFAGWYTDSNFKNRLYGLDGVAEDLDLYAKFVDYEFKKVSYVVPDGAVEIPYDLYYPGTKIAVPAQSFSQDKQKKLVWYLDEAMTHRLNNAVMPNEDLTLYSRWEDVVYSGFLDKGWNSLNDVSIDSYEDMVAFVEYVYFTGNTSNIQVPVTYILGKSNIEREFFKADTECTFPRHFNVMYNATDKSLICYFENKNGEYNKNKEIQATVTMLDKANYYTQMGDVFSTYQSSRNSVFNDFAINRVDKTYECETSDQLFYVLSHGYRPTPISGTPADRIYRQFKNIMRQICDDDMTDLQKAEAIYDWLILNVCYDYAVAYPDKPLAGPNCQYKAFFLEGVLEGAAVCDGLSKAYAVMCAIEGINCVRVTGSLKNAQEGEAGHAWNKIQLFGEWYLSDATWGNKAVSTTSRNYEYVSYEYFLFTDELREKVDNYISNEYGFYVADGDYDYYRNYKMQLDFTSSILGVTNEYTREFDLYIDGDDMQDMSAAEELSYVLEYIDRCDYVVSGMTVDIKVADRVNVQDFVNEAYRKYAKRVSNPTSRVSSFIGVWDEQGYVEKDAVITLIFSLPA